MTANQINYAKHLEGVRHNVVEETEANRANLARETETNRSNRQFELIGIMNAQAAQAQASAALQNAATNRMNADSQRISANANERNASTRAFEAQVANARYMTEASQRWAAQSETERSNRAHENETMRSNRAHETISQWQVGQSIVGDMIRFWDIRHRKW